MLLEKRHDTAKTNMRNSTVQFCCRSIGIPIDSPAHFAIGRKPSEVHTHRWEAKRIDWHIFVWYENRLAWFLLLGNDGAIDWATRRCWPPVETGATAAAASTADIPANAGSRVNAVGAHHIRNLGRHHVRREAVRQLHTSGCSAHAAWQRRHRRSGVREHAGHRHVIGLRINRLAGRFGWRRWLRVAHRSHVMPSVAVGMIIFRIFCE